MSDIKTPYLNGHMYEFDLCWLVEKILSFESQLNQAIDLKTIHYADPIQWDITTQYAPNTVVVDPKTGTAYISKVPVPTGILLTNTDYWTVIFNYQDIYTKIMEGVAFYNGQTDYASKALLVNDLVWYGLGLYRVTRAIEKGGKLIPGTNLVKTSIESLLSNYYGRDRVTTLLNDTLNVSGDYTINAGDVAETSTNHTTKLTGDMNTDIDGALTEKSLTRKTTIGSDSWPLEFKSKTIDLYNTIGGVFDTVSDLINSNLTAGTALVLGFYDAYDNEPIIYHITDSGTSDGGATLALANGKYAVALLDGGITPNTYGIDNTHYDAAKWNAYITFVNKTDGVYYKLRDSEYVLPITFHAKKSIIGCDSVTTFTTVGTFQNLEGKTFSSVVWLDNTGHFSASNLECKHVRIDSPINVGIYIDSGTNYDVDNVTCNNATYIGFYVRTCWHSKFSNLYVSPDRGSEYGIAYHYNDTSVNGTTNLFSNCYVSGYPKRGYYFGKMTYSTLINLSCDGPLTTPDYLYVFENVTLNIKGIGAESLTSSYFALIKNSNIQMESLYMESVTLNSGGFHIVDGGNFTLSTGYMVTPSAGSEVHLESTTGTNYFAINFNLTKAITSSATLLKVTGTCVYTIYASGYNNIMVGSNHVSPLKSLLE